MTRRLLLALLLAFGLADPAVAGVGGRSSPADTAEACAVPAEMVAPSQTMPRLTAAMATGKPLMVGLVGSSSSLGRGVSSPSHAYPVMLEKDLQELLGRKVTVLTRAESGLTAPLALARFDEMLSQHVALVVWETGTTDAVSGLALDRFGQAIGDGVRMVQAHGADVLLVDIQYSPQTAMVLNFDPYLDYLHREAEANDVMVFHRWDVMRAYVDSGRFNPAPDGAQEQFRNADFVNGCIGRLLAGQIAAGLKRQN